MEESPSVYADTDPGSGAALGEVFASIEVSQVIVRACTLCGGPRVIDEPCAGCGNIQPPIVHDLGQTIGIYRDGKMRHMWELVGRAAAEWRIQKANAQASLLRRDIPPNLSAEAVDQH